MEKEAVLRKSPQRKRRLDEVILVYSAPGFEIRAPIAGRRVRTLARIAKRRGKERITVTINDAGEIVAEVVLLKPKRGRGGR